MILIVLLEFRKRAAAIAMRGYLEWETALVGQLDEQERSVFTPDV